MSCLQFHCDYLTRMVIVGLQSRRLTLKTHLTKTSLRTCLSENAVVLDGCAYLWSVHWSKAGNISNLFNVSKDYIVKFLHQSNVFLIFDWYHDYSIKGVTPQDRTGNACCSQNLSLSTPLRSKEVTLHSTETKKQLTDLLA